MLFDVKTLDRIVSGEVDLVFRRWLRPSVSPGTRLRTAVGEIAVYEVGRADPAALTVEDARRAGFATTGELLGSLRAGADRVLYRVRVGYAGQDARVTLRERDDLTTADLDRIGETLRGIDSRSRRGPWTRAVLETIEAMPGRPARELAASLGRDTPRFKTDVRTLKEHGLTQSLEVGYRLSPRGRRVLACLRRR